MSVRNFYVSSKLCHRPMWLRKFPHNISCTWLAGEDNLDSDSWGPMWDKYLKEVQECTDFVMYVEEGEILKGALIEAGMALACGKPIQIVWAGDFNGLRNIAGSWITHDSVTIRQSIKDVQ